MSLPSPRLTYHSCEAPLAKLASSLLHRHVASSPETTLRKTRQLHALLLVSTSPTLSSRFLFNNLLSLYSRSGSIKDVHNLFDRMPERTVVSYNTIISAYSRESCKDVSFACSLFFQMARVGIKPNASTLASLVRASSSLQEPSFGFSLHAHLFKSGFLNNGVIQTALICMYSNHDCMETANKVFDEMPERDVIAWNSIIHCNITHGRTKQGLYQFNTMISEGLMPNNSSYSMAVNTCARTEDLKNGRIIHAKIIKSELELDLPLQNALLDMYSSARDMKNAIFIFERIKVPDLISWNSLISGFCNIGQGEQAINAFIQLRGKSNIRLNTDEYTFASVICASASLNYIKYGKPLHALVTKYGFESSIYVYNTLINMYFLNEEPISAQFLFDFALNKDVIMWTEMVVGYYNLGECELAMKYFNIIIRQGYKIDNFTLSSALNSSADLTMLKLGENLHSLVFKTGYENNMCVCGNLLDMYAKNGDLKASQAIFSKFQYPDLKCWNSMIGGFVYNRNAKDAFELFDEMTKRKMQPNNITYLSLLSACNHSKLVEKGQFYWFCMLNDNLKPGFKHYSCMASLLSRAGLLQETTDLIVNSPFANQSSELWRILLSSCVTFKNLDIGVKAAERAILTDPFDGSTYILLCKLYALSGDWEKVGEMRKRIREMKIEKEPGLSWIEIKNEVRVFSADGYLNLKSDECNECKKELERIQENITLQQMNEDEDSLLGLVVL